MSYYISKFNLLGGILSVAVYSNSDSKANNQAAQAGGYPNPQSLSLSNDTKLAIITSLLILQITFYSMLPLWR